MLLKKITHLQLKHSRQTRRYAHSEALKPGVCVCVCVPACVCVYRPGGPCIAAA